MLILLRPLFLRLPLPLVLVSCATVDVEAGVEARKAAVPKSTQKRHCVVHSDFSPLEHNRTGYLLTTELTWYSGSYTRRTAGCLSHSRFCLAS